MPEYDAATKRAVVQPALRTTYTNDMPPEDKPPLVNVPVVSSSGGGYVVHLPLRCGDPVWLIFAERGLVASIWVRVLIWGRSGGTIIYLQVDKLISTRTYGIFR